MKSTLKKLFSPILNHFEGGEGDYTYKGSHRKILIVVGLLFLALSLGSLILAIKASNLGGILPILVFFIAGSLCQIVGLLGSDRAVAKIWKNR